MIKSVIEELPIRNKESPYIMSMRCFLFGEIECGAGHKMPVSLKEPARMLNWTCKESSCDMREWVSMFVIVVYDVGSKRVSRIMKTCRKYLSHKQKSVFEGMITEAQLKKLK